MSTLIDKIDSKSVFAKGEVALVGAGPGDPELLTIKALRFIERAEVAVYDRLVSAEIMALLSDDCELIYVGKKQADHRLTQDKINELLAEQAKLGKRVLRLKGGDPFIFGRGGEEALHLLAEGVSCHVVPGMTAASSCAAYAGIPLTHRGVAQGCSFITGHLQTEGRLDLPWPALSVDTQTIVFYMGINTLPIIRQQLIEHGRNPHTPAAIIEKGTRPEQRTIRGTLTTLPELVKQHDIKPPSLIVIGDVVAQFDEENINNNGYLQATENTDAIFSDFRRYTAA
ncbi:uroporphyrinogen-III C-methyltransferase [Psychrobium sp. MM17-31]|uniref:uroporphyrinogen-III C-methyltransferase n=1 Tax=Psychrobium sp. MM17-31 TaxID=2917758 RepID=UPI001EF48A81|nr:uroporphyrinogen-III C-methyltransferase [Psychrobium sp. MM17-31]MCG7532958.1 uroporphyrinogen-III C-methyltransferase [Psychrobium sp. MM17-31]